VYEKPEHNPCFFDVRKNLVPDFWIADDEGALSELGPCPHGNSFGISIRNSNVFQMLWKTNAVQVCYTSRDLILNFAGKKQSF